jgi:hypothetical protein
MNDALRQTGRTTRLIEKAVQLAHEGRAVYIHTPERCVRRTQKQVDETWEKLWPGRPHGIKVEAPHPHAQFNWWEMRVLGAHPNSVWLVDHYLVERRIQLLQDQMAELAKEIGRIYPLTV